MGELSTCFSVIKGYSGNILGVFSGCTGGILTCSKVRGILWIYSGYTWGTYIECSKVEGILWVYSGYTGGILGVYWEYTGGILRVYSGYTLGIFRV